MVVIRHPIPLFSHDAHGRDLEKTRDLGAEPFKERSRNLVAGIERDLRLER